MTVFLRTAGALLLILAGAGGGFAAAARIGTQQRQCHTFARLLAYLAELLEAQALAGPELLARFRRRWPELASLPGAACAALGDGPAVYYTVPGWKGDIGFIAAVHGKFCASCNRVRLTSQGFLRPCLASEAGCDLKALLRSGASDEALLTAIRTTIWEKPQEHHFELKQDIPATRGMYRIGG